MAVVDQDHITRMHQAFGRNYQLPNTTAHNETCANIAGAMWNWRMFLLTGEAKYVDLVELALYNSILSGVSLNGTEYFYVNPLRVVDPLPVELRYPRTRQKFFTSFCCPPNVVRTIAEVGGYAYSKTDDAILVNLYGSNTLETELAGGKVKLTQADDLSLGRQSPHHRRRMPRPRICHQAPHPRLVRRSNIRSTTSPPPQYSEEGLREGRVRPRCIFRGLPP